MEMHHCTYSLQYLYPHSEFLSPYGREVPEERITSTARKQLGPCSSGDACSPCQRVQAASAFWDRSGSDGWHILPACSCYIRLRLSLSHCPTVVLMLGREALPPKGSWRAFEDGCYCTKKTLYVPQSLRNATLHLCFSVVHILRALTHLRTLIHSCLLEWMQFKVFLEKRRGAKIQEGTGKFDHELQLSSAKVMLLRIVKCSF